MDETTLQICLAIVLGLAILMMVPAGITSARLLRLIQARHPETWRDLGEPKLGPMRFETSARLRRFIRTRAYEALLDPEIDTFARRVRVLNLCLTILVGIGAMLVVAIGISATAGA